MSTGEALTLAQRVSMRLRAGALVVVVQEADEALALAECRAAAETCSPVTIRTVAAQDVADILEAHKTGEGTLILTGYLEVYGENPMSSRMIREVGIQTRTGDEKYSRLILIEQPHVKIPQGIVGDSEIIGVQLPTIEELRSELDAFIDGQRITLPGNGEERFALSSAVSGLPRHEASRLFARSFVEKKVLDPVWLRTEKALRVTQRLGGALSFRDVPSTLEMGGNEGVVEWIAKRKPAFLSQEARKWGLPRPRGVGFAGYPGTGKSLGADVFSLILGIPILALDAGKLFGSLVGQSEAQTRLAIDTARACAPCIVRIDEFEKGFGGSGGLDGGTQSRVTGTLLTALQEVEEPVFWIATVNRIELLPPELTRKGRFDEWFFFNMPTEEERKSIIKVCLKKRGRSLVMDEILPIAEASKNFSGAEIQQAVDEALFDRYTIDKGDLTGGDVLGVVKTFKPLYNTMSQEKLSAIREFASKCRPASNQKQDVQEIRSTGAVQRPRIG